MAMSVRAIPRSCLHVRIDQIGPILQRLEASPSRHVLLVLLLEQEGLGEQQHGDGDEGEEDEEGLKSSLSWDELVLDCDIARLHEHLDEGVEEGGRGLLPHNTPGDVFLAARRVVVGKLRQRRVPVDVALHDDLALPVEDRTPRRRALVLHAPHVLRQICKLRAVARDASAVVAEGSRPAGEVGELVVAVDLRYMHDLVVVQDERRVPVGRPLGEDEEDEVAEDGVDEDNLRDEDKVERDRVLEVEGVHQLAADAQHHLSDSNDDGKLHLERVGRVELVARVGPPRV
mmetsp:Transcript_16072/g.36745  ORF Transcript_16072/g.36745 Transcript_16072/m.36745 type:complete len:287 (-) Transcript_16072:443-1303(-)